MSFTISEVTLLVMILRHNDHKKILFPNNPKTNIEMFMMCCQQNTVN